MSIDNLLKAVPAPVAPTHIFAGPWEPVETELGLSLPQDYKDFSRIYGRGYFMEFLGVGIPRSTNPNTRLELKIPQLSSAFAYRDDLPHPIWPAPGGLVPFGTTDNGDILFWWPRDDLDVWGIAVWDRGLQTFETFGCDLTDFLAGLATGEILPEAFPEDLLPCAQLFKPD